MDTVIESIMGTEILDSRGNPTVEVEVVLADGSWGAPRCPQGLRLAFMRRLSCGTGINRVSWEKV